MFTCVFGSWKELCVVAGSFSHVAFVALCQESFASDGNACMLFLKDFFFCCVSGLAKVNAPCAVHQHRGDAATCV